MVRFAVDFDGTLVSDDHYPEMGEWLPGAQDFLRDLLMIGEVVIHTCRTSELYYGSSRFRPDTERWKDEDSLRKVLDAAGLYEVGIFTGRGKPAADYYIDNKAPFFPFLADGKIPDFRAILNEIIGYEEPRQEPPEVVSAVLRQFNTGATRSPDEGKIDPEGFINPRVEARFCEYMHQHRFQSDGEVRASDNWQKGIPLKSYAQSLVRHVLDFKLLTRGYEGVYSQDMEETLCAVIFNANGYLHELLKARAKEAA